MLLSNYSDQETWQNSTLIAQIVRSGSAGSPQTAIFHGWNPGIYENYLMEAVKKAGSKGSTGFL